MDQAAPLGSPAPKGTRWLPAALLLTMAVSALLLFLPLAMTAEGTAVSDPNGVGRPTSTTEVRQSLWQAEGWGVALLLLVPVLLCVLPLLVPRPVRPLLTVAVTVLFGMGVLVSLASIGLFYLPSLVLLVVAAVRLSRRSSASTT